MIWPILKSGGFMLNLIVDWILNALGLLLVAQVIPGFEVSGFGAALIAALAIGLVNATLGLVLKILTFPLTIVTLGLFWFVVNALMLELAAAFVPGFSIQGFVPAFLGAIALSVVNLLRRWVSREIREDKPRR